MRPKWWRWAVPAAAIAISLGIAETVLRVLDRDPITFYQFDQLRGWRLRPGHAGWYDDENRLWVQINRDGLKDREHAIDALPNTVRVAILGDSYMEAMMIPFEQGFAALLERQLDGCLQSSGKKAEVINFGVGGYSTAQELLTYRQDVLKYRPNVVLLAAYAGNDILDNTPALDYRPGGSRPYFDVDGETLVDPNWPPAPDTATALPFYQRWRLALTDRSYVATIAWNGYAALRALMFGAQPAAIVPGDDESQPLTDEQLTRAMMQPPRMEALQHAWQVTESLFGVLADEVKKNGSEFWMTTLSMAEQVNPDVAARAALAKELGVEDLYYPDDRISAFAMSRGIPIVSLARPLADHAASQHEFLNGGFNAKYPGGTGHWNATAHRLAAGIVADRLCRESRALSAK